ncbi:hypothetical protein [Azospirillum tabaci]|uniref:hypothetical protein n=1 Tax=Azospirillum tabaci TaxID=2752310 RepID=UPI00166045A6|nr:hypothetical protein [Azospirillum tabaci]
MTGYYLMHRGWMDNPALGGKRDPFCKRAAWAWLIEEAAWKDTRSNVGGKWVDLKRGQLCCAYRYLAEAWGWSLGTVQRFIDRLETDTMVTRIVENGRLILTICKYDEYQVPARIAKQLPDTEADTLPIRDRYATDTKENTGKELTLEADASRDVAAEPADEAQPDLIKLDRTETASVETLKAMAAIWRDVCGDVLPVPRGLDKGRQAALRRRLHDTFEGSLERWTEFCQRVRGSPFLTGENASGWRADLDFMLKPKNANKLLEGGYDDRKPRQPAAQQRRPAARSFEFDPDSGLGGILDGCDIVAPELDACGAGPGWRAH